MLGNVFNGQILLVLRGGRWHPHKVLEVASQWTAIPSSARMSLACARRPQRYSLRWLGTSMGIWLGFCNEVADGARGLGDTH